MHCRIFGLLSENWVSQKSLTTALGGGSLAQIHRYISSDPSVAVSGTALPAAAFISKIPQRSLQEIAVAAYAATEELAEMQFLFSKKSKTRTVFIRLAYQQGWRDADVLARFMQVPYITAWRLVRREGSKDCTSAALCLGDKRLQNL